MKINNSKKQKLIYCREMIAASSVQQMLLAKDLASPHFLLEYPKAWTHITDSSQPNLAWENGRTISNSN